MTKMMIISGENDVELMNNFNTFSEEVGDRLVSYESLDRLTMRVFFSLEEKSNTSTARPLCEDDSLGHPTCTGVCATCEWWTSANIGRRDGGRVKWGNCAILNGCATNEAQRACGHYVEVAK